jgi:hypothetical protein
MTEKDENDLDLFEVQKALADAKFAEVKTAAAVVSAHAASDGIRSIVERNGYIDRFREMLRGA